MSDIAMDAARLLEMLPESEQHFAYELIKNWSVPGTLILLVSPRKKLIGLQ